MYQMSSGAVTRWKIAGCWDKAPNKGGKLTGWEVQQEKAKGTQAASSTKKGKCSLHGQHGSDAGMY